MSEPLEPRAPGSPDEPVAPSGTGSGLDRDGDPEPGERRLLERPPGQRFRRASVPSEAANEAGTPARAVWMGLLGAAIGVVVYLILAIPFSFSAGLLIVALFTGRFIGLFVKAGAGGSLSSPARTGLAVVIFLGAMAVSIVLAWLWAGVEGGVLPLPVYLDEVYGTPLVALEFMIGTLLAWWSAR